MTGLRAFSQMFCRAMSESDFLTCNSFRPTFCIKKCFQWKPNVYSLWKVWDAEKLKETFRCRPLCYRPFWVKAFDSLRICRKYFSFSNVYPSWMKAFDKLRIWRKLKYFSFINFCSPSVRAFDKLKRLCRVCGKQFLCAMVRVYNDF